MLMIVMRALPMTTSIFSVSSYCLIHLNLVFSVMIIIIIIMVIEYYHYFDFHADTDLREVMTATLGVSECYNLGLELCIPPDILDNMENDCPNPSTFHRKMLRHWLCTKCASWLLLANALRRPLVNENGLADKITTDHPCECSILLNYLCIICEYFYYSVRL